jgi:hypothetical protein
MIICEMQVLFGGAGEQPSAKMIPTLRDTQNQQGKRKLKSLDWLCVLCELVEMCF